MTTTHGPALGIRARGLTKRYGSKVAVDGIDFGVEPGRVTGFLGPNGAGKSTTMRMILGFGVFVAEIAALALVAWLLLRRRDA